MSVIDHVGMNKMVKFSHYQDNILWYTTELGLEFPVPCHDTGSGVFLPEDKAILFMRWIRKHLETIENAKKEQP